MKTSEKDEERRLLGMTRAELRRDLGLDELTREACIFELFGELLEGRHAPRAAAQQEKGLRVFQAGPGRRHAPGEEGGGDAGPT